MFTKRSASASVDNVTELCKMIWLLTKSGDYVRYLKQILTGKSPSIVVTSSVFNFIRQVSLKVRICVKNSGRIN